MRLNGVGALNALTGAATLLILAACGHATTRSRPPDESMLHQDLAYVRATGFQPVAHMTVTGRGTLLLVVRGVCLGSADGHCQVVDAFLSGRRSPIWHRDYVTVRSITPAPGGFAVVADRYRPGDPLCCPSMPPGRTVYRWNGHRLVRG